MAPLYDVASALPYGAHEKNLQLAMKIGGEYRVFPYRNSWPKAAADLGLDPEILQERVRELAVLVPDVFAEAAKAPDVKKLKSPLPAHLVDLISDRSNRCLDVMV